MLLGACALLSQVGASQRFEPLLAAMARLSDVVRDQEQAVKAIAKAVRRSLC